MVLDQVGDLEVLAPGVQGLKDQVRVIFVVQFDRDELQRQNAITYDLEN